MVIVILYYQWSYLDSDHVSMNVTRFSWWQLDIFKGEMSSEYLYLYLQLYQNTTNLVQLEVASFECYLVYNFQVPTIFSGNCNDKQKFDKKKVALTRT